eukprot:1193282-Prorocentrum_minimum.AAC.2
MGGGSNGPDLPILHSESPGMVRDRKAKCMCGITAHATGDFPVGRVALLSGVAWEAVDENQFHEFNLIRLLGKGGQLNKHRTSTL